MPVSEATLTNDAYRIRPYSSTPLAVCLQTLHLSDEFTEANLGTKVEAGGQVTTRIVATQFAFDPQCVSFRQTSPSFAAFGVRRELR
jgi:hypothetical protein